MLLLVCSGHLSFYVYEKDMEAILSTPECVLLVA